MSAPDDYMALPGRTRRALLDEALAEHGNVCCICGLRIAPGHESLQHIQPRSKGGITVRENMKPAHKRCNSSLGNKTSDGPEATVHNGLAWMIERMKQK